MSEPIKPKPPPGDGRAPRNRRLAGRPPRTTPPPVPEQALREHVGPWRQYTRQRLDPLTSFVFTLPLFIVYQIGVIVIERRSGVDLVSEVTMRLIAHSTSLYIIVVLAICALMSAVLWVLQKRGHLVPTAFPPALLESLIWALCLFGLGAWLFRETGAAQQDVVAVTLLDAVILSAGAGFHEEVLFRVIGFAGFALLLRNIGTNRALAWLIAGVASSIAYGLAHTLGLDAQPFTLPGLGFRILAGACLAALYYARGFAIAAYTHAIYDLIVMLGNMDRSAG